MAGWFWAGWFGLFLFGQTAIMGVWIIALPLLAFSCVALRIYFRGAKK